MGLFELFSGLLAAFYAVIPSFGLAIILLTVVTRLVLLPLSIKQIRSMREMQAIQPEVKKLQAKYKGNRQKMNEEVMALYKEHGVNPLGGCLPLVLQFPVLIGLFYVIRAPLKYLGYMVPRGTNDNVVVAPDDYVEQPVTGLMEILQNSRLANELQDRALQVNEFLGLRLDCFPTAAWRGDDPANIGQTCGDGVLSALPYLILVALMGFTTYYQQRQMQASRGPATDAQAQQMQMMTRIMPLMLVFFGFTFPAGVVLYWVVTNVWTIGQQRLMLQVAPSPLPAKAAAGEDGAPTKKSSGKRGAGKPPKKTTEKPSADTKKSADAKTRAAGTRNRKKKR